MKLFKFIFNSNLNDYEKNTFLFKNYESSHHFCYLRSGEGGTAAAGSGGDNLGTGQNGEIVGGPRTPQQMAAQKRVQQTQAQVDEVYIAAYRKLFGVIYYLSLNTVGVEVNCAPLLL